jgi:hypothetical protein
MWNLILPLLALLGLWESAPPAAGGEGTGARPGDGARPPQPSGNGEGAGAGARPPSTPPKPEDGEPENELGEGGKKAIAEERRKAREAIARAEAAEAKLTELEAGTQTEHEREVTQARREAKAESDAKWAVLVRNAEVRGALRGAGIANEKFLGLALQATELADLKVDPESGEVAGITEGIEALRKALPEAFKAPAPPKGGQWDGAEGGGTGKSEPATLEEAVAAHYDEQQRRR